VKTQRITKTKKLPNTVVFMPNRAVFCLYVLEKYSTELLSQWYGILSKR